MSAEHALKIKPKSECRWDLLSLGEVMLRLDPGDGRVATTRSFQVWEGGGEYNVARGLKRCFGLNTGVVTALADNPVGRLVQDLIYQGGVDQSHVRWHKFDGVGRLVRNGLNFTERGFGVRAALGCSDRGHTAVSQLKPGDIDWEEIFANEGARWFHTGGIFCALSESTPEVAREAMVAAKKHGTIVSYDLNYRESLWKGVGGQARAQEVNRELAPLVDVMLGNEEDFTACLGFEVEGADQDHSKLEIESFRHFIPWYFNSCNITVMADAALTEARSSQHLFALIDHSQLVHSHFGSIRNSGRKTSRSGLIPRGQAV
jgi:2-dehydro-3-deoxygluconokinase